MTQDQRVRDFKLRVRLRLAHLGLSVRKASLEAGMHADTLGKMLKDDSGLPRAGTLEGLARALHTTEQWLLSGDEPAMAHTPLDESSGPSRDSGKEVEIKAIAAGSHENGAFQLFDASIGYTSLPRALAKFSDVYALIVINDSMVPEHRPGEIRFATPSIAPRIGDSVIIEFQSDPETGPEAMIAHFLGGGENYRLGKLNPAKTIQIPRSLVTRLHRIATNGETR